MQTKEISKMHLQGSHLILVGLIAFVLAYLLYGRWLSRRLRLGDGDPTPAHTRSDGIDYVPAPMPVVLGHHFASIAGASPIIGPVIALQYGWLPVFLWVLLGGIFFGAVHDLVSTVASLRHQGRSIGEIIEEYMGHTGKLLFLLFSWSTLILVIAVFTIIVAQTFVSTPAAATASLCFLVLAVLFGYTVYRAGVNFTLASIVGAALVFGSLLFGIYYPLDLTLWMSKESANLVWIEALVVYIFFASVAPVHILLQPRDYLNSFLLYGMILLGVLAVLVASPPIHAPAFQGFYVAGEGLGYLFPMLFVTVACGAISGFHALVSSGTSSKQIDKEKDALPIAYGGMLIECLLALLSLVAAAILLQPDYAAKLKAIGPVQLFSQNLSSLMVHLGIPYDAGVSFVALTVSAFALTSLDTATRLARFLFQEFFAPRQTSLAPGLPATASSSKKGTSSASSAAAAPAAPAAFSFLEAFTILFATNRYISTTITVVLGALLALSGGWKGIWPLFGATNQLLAALSLLSLTVWLNHLRIASFFVFLPMIFMFAVTQSALVSLLWSNIVKQQWFMTSLAALMILLSFFLVGLFARDLLRLRRPQTSSPKALAP